MKLPIPAFKARRPYRERHAAPAAQVPRIEIVMHRCGHETPETTETYTEAGKKAFREKFAKRDCGMCVSGRRTP